MRTDELREVEQAMAHWGFAVFDPVHPRSPGFRRLVVAIRPTPTYEHFDPEQLSLQTWGRQQAPEQNYWNRHTTVDGERQVVPGRIVVSDRVHKRFVFYTFGATVQATHGQDHAACTYFVVDSPAPILSKSNGFDLLADDELAEEAEALFARLRAKARIAGSDFDRRLMALTPIQVYAGCIESMTCMYRQSPQLLSMFPALCGVVRRERQWLAEQLNSLAAPLEQLLSEVGKSHGAV